MHLDEIQNICYIATLFIRSDGERFLLGGGKYQFASGQQHFAADEIVSDVQDIQGGDGVLLAGQVRRAKTQSFDGYILDGTSSRIAVESARRDFLKFFQRNYLYNVVYIFPSPQTAIVRRRGYIVDAPSAPELFQINSKFHVAFNFEDVNYYSYAEDEDGSELYYNQLTIPPIGVTGGGLSWEATGLDWGSTGLHWDAYIGNSIVDLEAGSISRIYPRITITGPVESPVFENITTGETIRYNGAVGLDQKLVIDMGSRTALLNGVNVVGSIEGAWVSLVPGENQLEYSAEENATPLLLEWQEVVA